MANRCFISRIKECYGNCKYCFGKWKGYKKFPIMDTYSDNTIIYPNCDGNFLDDDMSLIWDIIKNTNDRRIVISVSSKFDLCDEQIQELVEINNELKKNNNGFLKCSVSFSCSDKIPEIEPNTASLDERLKLIKKIVDAGLNYFTIIKPILPFVSFEEYKSIVDNTSFYGKRYVLGDLYVNPETCFYEEYIKGRYDTSWRNVSWNGENGIWEVVEDVALKNKIKNYIQSKGGTVFDSDQDAILDIIKSKEEECYE